MDPASVYLPPFFVFFEILAYFYISTQGLGSSPQQKQTTLLLTSLQVGYFWVFFSEFQVTSVHFSLIFSRYEGKWTSVKLFLKNAIIHSMFDQFQRFLQVFNSIFNFMHFVFSEESSNVTLSVSSGLFKFSYYRYI